MDRFGWKEDDPVGVLVIHETPKPQMSKYDKCFICGQRVTEKTGIEVSGFLTHPECIRAQKISQAARLRARANVLAVVAPVSESKMKVTEWHDPEASPDKAVEARKRQTKVESRTEMRFQDMEDQALLSSLLQLFQDVEEHESSKGFRWLGPGGFERQFIMNCVTRSASRPLTEAEKKTLFRIANSPRHARRREALAAKKMWRVPYFEVEGGEECVDEPGE